MSSIANNILTDGSSNNPLSPSSLRKFQNAGSRNMGFSNGPGLMGTAGHGQKWREGQDKWWRWDEPVETVVQRPGRRRPSMAPQDSQVFGGENYKLPPQPLVPRHESRLQKQQQFEQSQLFKANADAIANRYQAEQRYREEGLAQQAVYDAPRYTIPDYAQQQQQQQYDYAQQQEQQQQHDPYAYNTGGGRSQFGSPPGHSSDFAHAEVRARRISNPSAPESS
eukprot:CAMPEP_0175171722 /NCGR_PEP_ID=MMETSP0087-20121206/31010_1 /TAXON_ID=136419 /ORGANISM="Unknown Unknown, Strain D1" /LENGTH=222 /DNA_ID=CAMNT_0016462663 /DNA_START=31 /DNA_END=696 /DNA_ORIENTATION=-